jgi:hypothetical protein
LKNSRHWFLKFLLATYVLAVIWTSFTHAAEYRITKGAAASSIIPPKANSARYRRLGVRAYVQSASQSAGVNPTVAEWIVSHESRHHTEETAGASGKSIRRGIQKSLTPAPTT